MDNTLGIPQNFKIEAGDTCATAHFEPVEGADGYLLTYYNAEAPEKAIKTRRTEKSPKSVLGFKNGSEYLADIRAFVLSANGEEITGQASDKVSFIPVSNVLKAQNKLCLQVGETARIEWEYKNTRPEVIFESTNPDVVRVDDTGAVIALSDGDALIVTAMDEENFAVTNVSVGRGNELRGILNGSIVFTGDLMCAYRHQRDAYPRNYDFTDSMSFIRKRLSFADARVGVLETVICDSLPYEYEESRLPNGAPNCNSPSTFLRALKRAGFDVLITANNHNCDGGSIGLKSTVSNIRRHKMSNSGTFFDNPVYIDAGGIRVALISLCMICNGREMETDDSPGFRNIGRYSRELVSELIRIAKSDDTDYIVVCMHWGNMNSVSVTRSQSEEARFIAECGADLIIGSHPHLLQKAEIIETENGRKVLCAYSLGNFITTMNEMKGNRDGAALVLRLTKNHDDVQGNCSYIPFYSELHPAGMKVVCVERPVNDGQEAAYRRINGILGNVIPEDKPHILCIGSGIMEKIFDDTIQFDAELKHCGNSFAAILDSGEIDSYVREYGTGSYVMLDMLTAAEDDTFDAAVIISGLCTALKNSFGSSRIILLRLDINDRRVVYDQLRNGRNEARINERLQFLEQAFIELAHPVVIDISGYYFGDAACGNRRTDFEPAFYTDVRNRLDMIFSGNARTYHYEQDDDLWIHRVIRYYDNCSARSYWNWLVDKGDAAGMLIMNTSRSFVSEFATDIVSLKQKGIKALEDMERFTELSPEIITAAGAILAIDNNRLPSRKEEALMLRYGFNINKNYAAQLTELMDYPVSIAEIPFASSHLDNREEYIADFAHKKANIDIWGSCITRTSVSRNEDIVVANYIFKQPAILAFNEPMDIDTPSDVSYYENNAWRMHTMIGSVKHDGIERLKDRAAEWIVVDLYDLVTEVCKIGDDYLELDDFIKRTAFFKEIGRGKQTTYLFDDVFDNEAVDSFRKFAEFIREKYGKNIILVKIDLKDEYLDLDGELQRLKFDPAFDDKKIYVKMFEDLFEEITGCRVIDIAGEYNASDAFPLGGAHIVHYEDGFYDECCRRITEIVGMKKFYAKQDEAEDENDEEVQETAQDQ